MTDVRPGGGDGLGDYFAAAAPIVPVAVTSEVRESVVRTKTRWHKTSTTFSPAVKIVITVLIAVAALWSPGHALVSHLTSHHQTTASPMVGSLTSAVGGGVLTGAQSSAAASQAQQAATSVEQAASATDIVGSLVTWAIEIGVGGAVLMFVWRRGDRVVTNPGP